LACFRLSGSCASHARIIHTGLSSVKREFEILLVSLVCRSAANASTAALAAKAASGVAFVRAPRKEHQMAAGAAVEAFAAERQTRDTWLTSRFCQSEAESS
jgi:hypothetical protein